VGERCVVRHRLPDGSATDVIGELTAADGTTITVAPRPGEHVTIRAVDVVVIKVVPEVPRGRAPRRTTPAELEQLAAPGWLGDHERLGEWWLRAAHGFTGRANSACAVGDPGVPTAAAAAAVIDFATRHGIAPMAQVVQGSTEDAALVGLGWAPTYVVTDVLAQRLSDLVADRPADPSVVVADQLDDTWLAAFRRYRPVDDLATVRRVLADEQGAAGFGAAYDEHGSMISIGRVHVAAGWAGVSALWTDPTARRRGRATAVLVALARWAARRGARNGYLQVAQENTGAHDAYARLGFALHHTYGYLRPPG
jgi:GNAT superfamily N-acetyltransferase